MPVSMQCAHIWTDSHIIFRVPLTSKWTLFIWNKSRGVVHSILDIRWINIENSFEILDFWYEKDKKNNIGENYWKLNAFYVHKNKIFSQELRFPGKVGHMDFQIHNRSLLIERYLAVTSLCNQWNWTRIRWNSVPHNIYTIHMHDKAHSHGCFFSRVVVNFAHIFPHIAS